MISDNELENLHEFYYILKRIYSNNTGEHLEFHVLPYQFKLGEEKMYNRCLMFKTQEEAEYSCFEMNSLYGY